MMSFGTPFGKAMQIQPTPDSTPRSREQRKQIGAVPVLMALDAAQLLRYYELHRRSVNSEAILN